MNSKLIVILQGQNSSLESAISKYTQKLHLEIEVIKISPTDIFSSQDLESGMSHITLTVSGQLSSPRAM